MTSRSPEEQLADNIATMGEDLGRTYSAIWQELAYLHLVWFTYKELFGTSEARVQLLNRASAQCTGVLQEALYRDVILGIARLTDKERVSGKTTLTVRRLQTLTLHADSRFVQLLEDLVDRAMSATKIVRTQRNRILAHRDLGWAVDDPHAEVMPLLSRQDIGRALESVVAVVNAVSERFADTSISFQHVDAEGAVDLLYVVHAGVTARERRHENPSTCANDDWPDDL